MKRKEKEKDKPVLFNFHGYPTLIHELTYRRNSMKPGFRLNEHDRATNPCFEAHDPSLMWDPVNQTYYSYCTDAAITSKYKQGIPIRKSKDLVDFEFAGYALSDKAVAEGSYNGEDFMRTPGFWAPYVEVTFLKMK